MAYLKGTLGNDTLSGSARDDVIDGFAGRDTLSGGSGDDVVRGGDGDDLLSGGLGSDLILGGRGDDRIAGSLDLSDLGSTDRLYGQAGRDTIFAGTSNGYLDGGAGDDIITGGPGNDRIFGREDDDILMGAAGNDLLDGGFGADFLAGGTGTNTLLGRSGDDVLLLGGRDTADAGDGFDQVHWFGSDTLDATVTLGSGRDQVTPGYDTAKIGSAFYPGGGTVTILDFVHGEDRLDGPLILPEPASGSVDFDEELGSKAGFADYDTNGDGALNGLDRGVVVDGGDLTINLNVAVRDAFPLFDQSAASIGHPTFLKLVGITELTATDFTPQP